MQINLCFYFYCQTFGEIVFVLVAISIITFNISYVVTNEGHEI